MFNFRIIEKRTKKAEGSLIYYSENKSMVTAISALALLIGRFLSPDGTPVRFGGQGRPTTTTLSDLANDAKQTLGVKAAQVAQADPVAFVNALCAERRPLTQAEIAALAKTEEAEKQGFADEPLQVDINARFDLAGAGPEKPLGDVLGENLPLILAYAQAQANASGRTIYVRFYRRVVARDFRGSAKRVLPVALRGLENLSARYAGAVYVSDSPKPKGALFTLATVRPVQASLVEAREAITV